MFTRLGVIHYPAAAATADAMLEAAIEAGADNAESTDGRATRSPAPSRTSSPCATRWRPGSARPPAPSSSGAPTTTVTLDEEQATGLLKLIDALEDNDDVQNVFANFDIPDDVMARLAHEAPSAVKQPVTPRGSSASTPACASPAGASSTSPATACGTSRTA